MRRPRRRGRGRAWAARPAGPGRRPCRSRTCDDRTSATSAAPDRDGHNRIVSSLGVSRGTSQACKACVPVGHRTPAGALPSDRFLRSAPRRSPAAAR
ncbi:hypothetical protein ACG83_02065 [Frankia sp. R43]|nr:hypothetical protein ACG83_02065 [Frankia sp. R43]